MPGTSSGRRSSGCGSRRGRRGAGHRLLGRPRPPGTPIIRDPTYLTAADYVLVESTYGGREHEPQDEAIRILAETVRLVAEADGVLLVPSFAIGRTQEVVWELDRLIDRGEIPLLPLYLDSPMAAKASDIYRHHPSTSTRRPRSSCATATRRSITRRRSSRTARRSRRPSSRAPAVHDRRLERDADRRPSGRPPAQPHRRPERHDPVRRLPGRGDAGGASPGRCADRPPRRPAAPGPLQGPLDRRLLGPRRRERAARLAGPVRRGQAAGRAGIRGGSSSSTATRRPRSRWSRRSGSSASRPTCRTGTSG